MNIPTAEQMIDNLEWELFLLRREMACAVNGLAEATVPHRMAYWTVRQMMADATIVALTDSLATLKRQAEGEKAIMHNMEKMVELYYGDGPGWGKCWLDGKTEWWPDNIPLADSKGLMRQGDPSSPMPALAQERTQALRDADEDYVVHISPGLHAYHIGPVSDYQAAEEKAAAGSPATVPESHAQPL